MTELCSSLNKSLLPSQKLELVFGIVPTHITLKKKKKHRSATLVLKWENVIFKESVLLHFTELFHIVIPRLHVISHHWTGEKKRHWAMEWIVKKVTEWECTLSRKWPEEVSLEEGTGKKYKRKMEDAVAPHWMFNSIHNFLLCYITTFSIPGGFSSFSKHYCRLPNTYSFKPSFPFSVVPPPLCALCAPEPYLPQAG